MAVTLITVSDYARRRGCDEKAVRKAIAEGRITRTGTDRKCIDPEVADIQWAKNTRARGDSRPGSADRPEAGTQAAIPLADGAVPPGSGPTAPAADDYTTSRARRERAEASMAEIAAQRAAGEVYDKGRADQAVADAFRKLSERVFAMPRRAAGQVAGMVEPREIEAVLEAELHKAFAEWHESIAPKLESRMKP